jgi:1,4-dihydroxy-2-naphthoyl-CoA hydrolase
VNAEPSVEAMNALMAGRLPCLIGMTVTEIGASRIAGALTIRPELLAPNGYLHAATVITLADTLCGLGCRLALPEDAAGFTTLELKSSFLGTCRDGTITCVAELQHGGRRTQVWDATVLDPGGRKIALFRCTQMILHR